jgi:hypothetical protein
MWVARTWHRKVLNNDADLAGMMLTAYTQNYSLADDVIVYPAHGAGGAGKTWEKKHSLLVMEKPVTTTSKEEFIKAVTTGIAAPPQYFPINAKINKEGYDSLDEVLTKGMKALTVEEFKKQLDDNTIILDTERPCSWVLFRFHQQVGRPLYQMGEFSFNTILL